MKKVSDHWEWVVDNAVVNTSSNNLDTDFSNGEEYAYISWVSAADIKITDSASVTLKSYMCQSPRIEQGNILFYTDYIATYI